MWWLDPGKEVLNVVCPGFSEDTMGCSNHMSQLFNRILAPYVMNLDLNQVNYGIGQGQSVFSRREQHVDRNQDNSPYET